MTSGELIPILRKQIQDSWGKRAQVREKLGTVEKNLKVLFESTDEIDDRRVVGIDISRYKDNLESFLKKHFDLTDVDLETEDQKERFAMELKRAEITIELEELENRIANCNRRLMQVDTSSAIFGPENYDPRNLEMYNLLITLEKKLRDVIWDTFESSKIPKWWKNHVPEGRWELAKKLYNDDVSKIDSSQNKIRIIDYFDFTDYYLMFEYGKNNSVFFKNDEKEKKSILLKLFELKDLRNKIVHRPPLYDEESDKFRVYYSDVMNFLKKLEKKNG